jgi:CheY-like chemotaxis protein
MPVTDHRFGGFRLIFGGRSGPVLSKKKAPTLERLSCLGQKSNPNVGANVYEEWEKLSAVTGWVVVVEDDPTVRLLMVDMLTEIGLQSVDFETADDALTYLLSLPEDCPLVIADHGLPGQLQGAKFIEIVKAKWPSTATILTSGYKLDASIIPSSTTYLDKPWSLNDLLMAVAYLLQPDRPLDKKLRWLVKMVDFGCSLPR